MAHLERKRFPDSEAVCAIAYDARRHALDVDFVSGGSYRYFEVPEDVFDRFRNAESAGQFMHEEILDQYRYEKLN